MTSDSQRLTSTNAPAIEAAITSVKAGHVSGWVKGADQRRLLALYVGRRRVATTRQTNDTTENPQPTQTTAPTAIDDRASFTFDVKNCPPDLLSRPTLALDVAILGNVSVPIASIEVPGDSLLSPQDLTPLPSAGEELKGCIDQLGDNLLRGWVCDPARPERRLDLFVFTNDRYQGRYVADQPRPDLAAIGHGDGTYGFTIPLPAAGAKTVVIAGDPEYWPIPPGVHALSKSGLRTNRKPTSLIEAFARSLTSEPFPKKVFVLQQIKQSIRREHRTAPDPFATDYVVLALECLRHDLVEAAENMTTSNASWRYRLKLWIKMAIIGSQIRRLQNLATTLTETPKLIKSAAQNRRPETKKVSIDGLT